MSNDSPIQTPGEKHEVTYDDFIKAMEELVSHELVPAKFFVFITGCYEFREPENRWYFKKANKPFEYDPEEPWVLSNGPFPSTDEEAEDMLSASAEKLGEWYDDLSKSLARKRMRDNASNN